MDNDKWLGSPDHAAQDCQSECDRPPVTRKGNRKISPPKSGPDDLLIQHGHGSAGARKSKFSSQGPQQSKDPGPVEGDPPDSELLTPKEAARFINMSESFLAKARMNGDGPRYLKLGRAVRYRESDLVAWLKMSAKTSTAE